MERGHTSSGIFTIYPCDECDVVWITLEFDFIHLIRDSHGPLLQRRRHAAFVLKLFPFPLASSIVDTFVKETFSGKNAIYIQFLIYFNEFTLVWKRLNRWKVITKAFKCDDITGLEWSKRNEKPYRVLCTEIYLW